MTIKSRKKIKYLENEWSIWDEVKSIFDYFSRALIESNKTIFFDGEGPTLETFVSSVSIINHVLFNSLNTKMHYKSLTGFHMMATLAFSELLLFSFYSNDLLKYTNRAIKYTPPERKNKEKLLLWRKICNCHKSKVSYENQEA